MARKVSIPGIFKTFTLIVLLVAVIAIGIMVYSTCAGGSIIQRIDKTKPEVIAVPFEVSTATKTYLTPRAVLNDDKSVTMYGWYERDGGKWVYHDKSITLPSVLKPRIGKRVE